ncbi:agmatine deiminase family protein [Streptomyces sp. MUM 203J]|uniref:agmatine deiminase family protein n=1 Tax=Streptomyces sp. MUM 203J TaxID=2791990 RepID=UPI001F0411ED|nr:agmatine deiminase family protein [Streptomyces sp. MUM 203J]MCH0542106.1 agmatine deiminase family protein [Streptomyces sp. MUM 203J]
MRRPDRRSVLRGGVTAVLAAAGLTCCTRDQERQTGRPAAGTRETAVAGRKQTELFMPAETREHVRTFMSWPPLDSVWEDMAGDVQRDIAGIARALAEFEPVVMLAAPEETKAARRACGSGVDVIAVPTDDLWMRDSGPTFVQGPEGLQGVDLHFNGWGGKQEHGRDAEVARSVLEYAGIPRIDAPLVGEGGSLEVDGRGTLLVTESSLVNANRNPDLGRDEIETALKHLVGADQVIWFKGVEGQDITDYHVDSLARFADDGVVLLSRAWEADGPDVWTRAYDQARGVLENATDARGRKFEIIDLPEPDPARLGRRGEDFLGSYANYYIANDAVLVPRFGDRKADQRAAAVIGDLHPGREIVQLEIHTVAEGGGGIHCATQQQPKA